MKKYPNGSIIRPVQSQSQEWKRCKYCFYYKYCLELFSARNQNKLTDGLDLCKGAKIKQKYLYFSIFCEILVFLQGIFFKMLFLSTVKSYDLSKIEYK